MEEQGSGKDFWVRKDIFPKINDLEKMEGAIIFSKSQKCSFCTEWTCSFVILNGNEHGCDLPNLRSDGRCSLRLTGYHRRRKHASFSIQNYKNIIWQKQNTNNKLIKYHL